MLVKISSLHSQTAREGGLTQLIVFYTFWKSWSFKDGVEGTWSSGCVAGPDSSIL